MMTMILTMTTAMMTMTMITGNLRIPMASIYKGDRVTLLSGKEGEILDQVDAALRTYRIRLIENNEIVYFDDTKFKLKRKHFLNVLLRR